MIIDDVRDRRSGSVIGSWLCEPLIYDKLGPADIGRTVIYRDFGRAQAGTITSWRDRLVFARYTIGDTAAGACADDLVFGIRALTEAERIKALEDDLEDRVVKLLRMELPDQVRMKALVNDLWKKVQEQRRQIVRLESELRR